VPGVMVHLSPPLEPAMLKGLKIHPGNPFQFDFILDQGNSVIPAKAGIQYQEKLKQQSTKLIKYFLASLTIPEKDLWVNLSPYEKNRIIPQSFGLTEMGRDLLAEDYMLKQITASLIYPEGEVGKKFWKRVYAEAAHKFGTTNILVNTFNKVWIVPDKAVVYENAKAGTAYVVEAKLKVMLEQDYLALSKNSVIASEAKQSRITHEIASSPSAPRNDSSITNILHQIIIPELTREVNQGQNFAQLRQAYNSLILAAWYKKKIKESILQQVYADKNKVKGLSFLSSPNASIGDPQRIYQQYLKAFKKGVYNYIKDEIDPLTQQPMPRKYFSGGIMATNLVADGVLKMTHDGAQIAVQANDFIVTSTMSAVGAVKSSRRDMAMRTRRPAPSDEHSGIAHWQDYLLKGLSAEIGRGDEQLAGEMVPMIIEQVRRQGSGVVPLISVGSGTGFMEVKLREQLPEYAKNPITVIEPALNDKTAQQLLRKKVTGLTIIPKKIENVRLIDMRSGRPSPIIFGTFFLEYTPMALALSRLKDIATPDAHFIFALHYYRSARSELLRKEFYARRNFYEFLEYAKSFLDGNINSQEFEEKWNSLSAGIKDFGEGIYDLASRLYQFAILSRESGIARDISTVRGAIDQQIKEAQPGYLRLLTQFAPFVDDPHLYIPPDLMPLDQARALQPRFNKIFATENEVRSYFEGEGFVVDDVQLRSFEGKPDYFLVKLARAESGDSAMRSEQEPQDKNMDALLDENRQFLGKSYRQAKRVLGGKTAAQVQREYSTLSLSKALGNNVMRWPVMEVLSRAGFPIKDIPDIRVFSKDSKIEDLLGLKIFALGEVYLPLRRALAGMTIGEVQALNNSQLRQRKVTGLMIGKLDECLNEIELSRTINKHFDLKAVVDAIVEDFRNSLRQTLHRPGEITKLKGFEDYRPALFSQHYGEIRSELDRRISNGDYDSDPDLKTRLYNAQERFRRSLEQKRRKEQEWNRFHRSGDTAMLGDLQFQAQLEDQHKIERESLELLGRIHHKQVNLEEFISALQGMNRLLLRGKIGSSKKDISRFGGKFRANEMPSEKLKLLYNNLEKFTDPLFSKISTRHEMVEHVADFYMTWIKMRGVGFSKYLLFKYGNRTMSLGVVNAMLQSYGLNGISDAALDNYFLHHKENVDLFQEEFLAQVRQANPGVDLQANVPEFLDKGHAADTAMISTQSYPPAVRWREHQNNFDTKHVSYLNRYPESREQFRKFVLPFLIDRAKLRGHDTNHFSLEVVVLGASTGEELARTYHEIIRDLIKRGEDLNSWSIRINGIENNNTVYAEAERRLQGVSPFEWGVGVGGSSVAAHQYANEILETLNSHSSNFSSSIRLYKKNINDQQFLKEFSGSDLVLFNSVRQYMSSVEAENLFQVLDTWENAVVMSSTVDFSRVKFSWQKHLLKYQKFSGALFPKDSNSAMVNGGIDFNSNKMNLQVKTGSPTGAFGDDKGGIKFHIDQAMLRQLQDAPGFMPVIIHIQPMTNLRAFLGIK